MNIPVYLGLSILELSKILMYEFRYDNVKLKYGKKSKLCYMDTDNFIASMTTNDIQRHCTSNYELEGLLPNEKNKKVIGLKRDELGR